MKRLAVLAMALLMSMSVAFAQSVEKFLERYEDLIERVEDINSSDPDEEDLKEVKAEYKKLTKEVDRVKSKMSNDELKRYYKLKAKYQKKIATIKAKRGFSTVKGWVQGWFE